MVTRIDEGGVVVALDKPSSEVVIPYEALLEHWQGHRRVTRRMIEAFPDDALFAFSVGGMRPFSAMALEMIRMTSAGMRGLATREWPIVYPKDAPAPGTKPELLRALGIEPPAFYDRSSSQGLASAS
jgi:hypothetical protein